LQKSRKAALPVRVVFGQVDQHPDAPHALALLRLQSERPHCRCTTEKADELAPLKSRRRRC
jgi:hypothetical protein